MAYTKAFTKPYAAWHDLPTKDTPVNAAALEEYDSTFAHIEDFLDGSTAVSPTSKTSAMTQAVGVDSNGALWTEPGGGGGGGGSTFSNLTVGTRATGSTVGTYSVAEGYWATSSGENSHAEGSVTTASGHQSHAEGSNTTASGTNSHAEGTYTTASGNGSHAEGAYTIADGTNSHASGDSTTAYGNNQFVCGKYNANVYSDLFEVGNGTNGNPSNAFAVDSSGNIEMKGHITAANATTLSDSDYVYVSVSGVIKKITVADLKTVLGIT